MAATGRRGVVRQSARCRICKWYKSVSRRNWHIIPGGYISECDGSPWSAAPADPARYHLYQIRSAAGQPPEKAYAYLQASSRPLVVYGRRHSRRVAGALRRRESVRDHSRAAHILDRTRTGDRLFRRLPRPILGHVAERCLLSPQSPAFKMLPQGVVAPWTK